VARPTALGSRQIRSISLPTSEFGLKNQERTSRCGKMNRFTRKIKTFPAR